MDFGQGGMMESKPQGMVGYRKPTMLENLREKQTILEAQLKEVNAAVEAFEKHPELADMLEKLHKVI